LFGESRVQELEQKAPLLPQAQWHFIGALQRNKARRAVELCSLLHSLDSLRLGEVLDRLGSERGQPVHALVEVNLGGEASKSGVALGEVEALIEALAGRRGLRIDGLMTIPPPADAETTRAYFQRLAALADSLQGRQFPQVAMHQLSMGMSEDFTAIFGPR
jgi:pyridoxal phosphate enzyme (YggS family)